MALNFKKSILGAFFSLSIAFMTQSVVWGFDQNVQTRYELNPNQSIRITYEQIRTQDVEVFCRATPVGTPPTRGEELFQRALNNDLGRCLLRVGDKNSVCEYYIFRKLANGKTSPYDNSAGCLKAQHAERYNIRCNSRVEKLNAICILETLMGEGACLY